MRSLLRDWDLTHKTFSFVRGNVVSCKRYGVVSHTSVFLDQGSNVLRAGRISDWLHLECFAHRLNLFVTVDGFQDAPVFKSLLGKCKAIVKFLRFKAPEVAETQKELTAFLENYPAGDHTYGNLCSNCS